MEKRARQPIAITRDPGSWKPISLLGLFSHLVLGVVLLLALEKPRTRMQMESLVPLEVVTSLAVVVHPVSSLPSLVPLMELVEEKRLLLNSDPLSP